MTAKKHDYASLRSELDDVLEQLQSEEVDIDKAVKLYKRGTELLAQIDEYLVTAKNTVKTLKTTPTNSMKA